MLPQVSTEALYSATFVENYLDCVENLPDDLQRLLSRMRELDVTYRGKQFAKIIELYMKPSYRKQFLVLN